MAIKKFIIVVGEDVASYFVFDDSIAKNINLSNQLINDPIIMEIPVEVEVMRGYIYDGENFIPPN